jgi:hypothetical protein
MDAAPEACECSWRMATLERRHLLAVRLGHGANCSSIGSVVDTLFLTGLVGGAVFAAIMATLESEPVSVVGPGSPRKEAREDASAERDEASR